MWQCAVAALACLCVARCSAAIEPHSLRLHSYTGHSKELSGALAAIDERLRVLDTITATQAKQDRRLDVIQDKLDRMETTLSLRLERAQLAAERLEHRLHMLQTSVQTSIKESSDKLEQSEVKVAEIAQNLTNHLESHKQLLEKVNNAYIETWRKGVLLESLMRDGLSLINKTRREFANGMQTIARQQRNTRLTSTELESAFAKRLSDNTNKFDSKMQEILEAQKRFVDSCQRVQQDDPTQVANVLDKLIDSIINKTAATFHELQTIHASMKNHDNRVMKMLGSGRYMQQSDATCRRLELAFRNSSQVSMKDNELQQLTEKFIALTDRADAALQRLDAQLSVNEPPGDVKSDVTAEADQLWLKLKGIKTEQEDDQYWDDKEEDDGYFDDGGGGDMMEEDKEILNAAEKSKNKHVQIETTKAPHQRHLHNHPYDRGPD